MKHAPRSPGVYLIWNNQTMKFYIGSAINIYRRIRSHKSRLKRGYHSNPELQADYLLYGSDAFQFLIVEEFDRAEDANACEKKLIEEFAYKEFLYNFYHTGKPDARKGKRLSDEHRARMSAAKKGKRLSAEHCARMSAANKGRRLSDEHRARISEGQKLRWAERRQAAVDVYLTCAP